MTYSLTEAQVKFAAHYAEHGKQQDAYLYAYSASVNPAIANERGRRLLRNAAVRERIEKLRGIPLSPADTVRDPRSRLTAERTGAETNRDTAEAVKALASVVVAPAIPHDLRHASLLLLQDMLANIGAHLAGHPPGAARGGVRGLSGDPNGGSMVGNGAGQTNAVVAGGRH